MAAATSDVELVIGLCENATTILADTSAQLRSMLPGVPSKARRRIRSLMHPHCTRAPATPHPRAANRAPPLPPQPSQRKRGADGAKKTRVPRAPSGYNLFMKVAPSPPSRLSSVLPGLLPPPTPSTRADRPAARAAQDCRRASRLGEHRLPGRGRQEVDGAPAAAPPRSLARCAAPLVAPSYPTPLPPAAGALGRLQEEMEREGGRCRRRAAARRRGHLGRPRAEEAEEAEVVCLGARFAVHAVVVSPAARGGRAIVRESLCEHVLLYGI